MAQPARLGLLHREAATFSQVGRHPFKHSALWSCRTSPLALEQNEHAGEGDDPHQMADEDDRRRHPLQDAVALGDHEHAGGGGQGGRDQERCGEVRRHGVRVMALCPGVTETNFFDASKIDRPPMRTIQTPEEVVEAALRGLSRKKSVVISGWINWFTVEAERFVPRNTVTKVTGKALRSRFE